MFYKSPKAYKFLRDQKKFALPCESLIRRWVNEIELESGIISVKLLKLLSVKANSMSPFHRECVLIWDEMSIKTWLDYNSKKDVVEGYTDLGPSFERENKMAKHALVFLIRGRTKEWRCPISYTVCHTNVPGPTLSQLILQIIDFVEMTGFKVKSMVCDLGTSNSSAIKNLDISEEKPYIIRHDRKIFFNYDAPHLIKCLRNNLMKNNIVFGQKLDKVASWSPIVELFRAEEHVISKSAPNLSDKHLFPEPFDLLNVSLATQVFSNSVSKGLYAGLALGELKNNA